MARFGSLDTQYFDDAGDPLVSGKIYFYETGTTTPKNTYADINYTIANSNPVILTAAGRQPNIFFDGVAKAILTKSDDTQILVRDPVGDTASTFGNAWIASKDYNANDVVQGSDGEFYVSLVNGNVNNNPVTTSGYWTFLYSVEWSAGTTYKLGSVVTYQTIVYQSLQNANLNKNPSTETSWWVPIQLVWSSTATYAINANVVGTDGILYTSLQNANTNHIPASSPSWWVGTSAAAASSASAAATSASNAASSASAASTSASNAATSESNAAASASTASTQATNASNYSAAASTSATNAANSASAAATSASNAAASYDLFDDRYLGAKASDPSVDNDGNPLVTGAMYFNTTSNTTRIYNGSGWQDSAAIATSINLATQVTGTLAVANGGTGATSLTASAYLKGNGTSAITAQTGIPAGDITSGTLAVARGGTGLTALGTSLQQLRVNSAGTALEYATISAGITNVVTATSSTTLTSTPTLLEITPTGYGNSVKLPDATTMTEGSGKFIVQNKSPYHVRITNNSNTLLGFVYGFKTATIDLADNATSAGAWVLSNCEKIGLSSEETFSLAGQSINTSYLGSVVDLDSDRSFILFTTSSAQLQGVVYTQSTNTYGTVVVIRASNPGSNVGVRKIDTDKLLVCSVSSATAFQAVVVSISGSTITVNTAATYTLAASISSAQVFEWLPSGGAVFGWSDGTNNKIIGMSVSGTTVTIGTETTAFTPSGSHSMFGIAVSNTIVLAVGLSTTGGFIAYSLSGSTLTAGTRVNFTASGIDNLKKFMKLTDSTFFFGAYSSGMSSAVVGVISLSGTTITKYESANLASASNQGLYDAIKISDTKVLFTFGGSQVYTNILTFTGSAVTLGTSLTTSSIGAYTQQACVQVVNNIATLYSTNRTVQMDVSGASPFCIYNQSYSANSFSTGARTVYGDPSGLESQSIYSGTINGAPHQIMCLSKGRMVQSPTMGIAGFSDVVKIKDNYSYTISIDTVSTLSGSQRTVFRKVEVAQ